MWGAKLKERPSWPAGMAIKIEDRSQHLNMLLFVRQAWELSSGDLPQLTPLPDVGTSQMPTSASADTWEDRWSAAWAQAWDWFSYETPPGGPRPVPPFWVAEYGWEGIDKDAFDAWDRQLLPHFPSDAERKSLAELIEAWKTGIDTVVVMPYVGYFARRLTRRILVVSAETRNDAVAYREALRSLTP